MEAKILNLGLKAIEKIYEDSMYNDEVWGNDFFRIKDIIHSLDANHWESKQWLVEELSKVYKGNGVIHVAGGWYGLLGHLLQKQYPNNKVISSDIDPITKNIGKRLFPELTFQVTDINDLECFYNSEVFVCTSIEHIDREDVINLIDTLGSKGKLFALQSNNYFDLDSHINCSESLDEFVDYLGLEVLYKGELSFGNFKRYMVIGR